MARPSFTSVDTYLAAQPAAARRVLERVRTAIRKALPAAEEGISYGIPVYKAGGRMVIYFAGFKAHYSIYPATAALIAALGDDRAGHLHSKATLRFSYDEPVPVRLLVRIAKVRAEEVEEQAASRATGKVSLKGRKSGARLRAAKKS